MGLEFVNITREEFLSKKLLHKYMPLEYALDSLNNRHLWFANPTTWKDPFEKKFVEAEFTDKATTIKFPWNNRVFCICMTQTATSEAYWNTYSRADIGIALKFRRSNLLDLLEKVSHQYNVYIGQVEYMKTSSINKPISQIPFTPTIFPDFNDPKFNARLLLLKRNAYKYEDEIRIIIVKNNPTQEQGIYISYDCQNTDLIDSLTLDPSIGPHTINLLKDVFERQYHFMPVNTSKGTRYRVQRSNLYAKIKPQTITI